MLQPFKVVENDEDAVHTEILPQVFMLRNSALSKPLTQKQKLRIEDDIFAEIAHIKSELVEESGFYIWDIMSLMGRDYALLPNGLTIQVDPDNVAPIDDPEELSAAFKKFAELQDKLNLPLELRWLDKNGQRVQNRFFPNPF